MQEYLQTFDFSAQPVRIVMRADAPWFVAADVCRILGISNPRDAVADLDEDEQSSVSRAEMTVATTDGQKNRGGAQFFNLISESGLYALVFKSRKEEAKAFRRWVTSEVLPALRRTGRYAVQAGAVQEERLSILEFVSDCCSGWSMERQIEMGQRARRFCKAMGLIFEVAERPGVGRVFTFPRQVLDQVRMSYVAHGSVPDSDAAEYERLLEMAHRSQGDCWITPEILRGFAKSMGIFPRIFRENTSLESERSGFGRLVERFDGVRFPSGYSLQRRGTSTSRRYWISRLHMGAALTA